MNFYQISSIVDGFMNPFMKIDGSGQTHCAWWKNPPSHSLRGANLKIKNSPENGSQRNPLFFQKERRNWGSAFPISLSMVWSQNFCSRWPQSRDVRVVMKQKISLNPLCTPVSFTLKQPAMCRSSLWGGRDLQRQIRLCQRHILCLGPAASSTTMALFLLNWARISNRSMEFCDQYDTKELVQLTLK